MVMDYEYLWFRLTQVAMKVGPMMVTLFLLAPLAVIFWRMARHHPLSETEARAQLEQQVREQLAQSQAELQAENEAAQAQKAREFEQMLEQAKEDGPSAVLSSDGTFTEVGTDAKELDRRVEDLERYIRSSATAPASTNLEWTSVGTTVTSEERVFLTEGTATWFSLHPRRWVGMVGLAAVTLIVGLVVWSALVPARPPISISGSMDASGVQIEAQAPASGGNP